MRALAVDFGSKDIGLAVGELGFGVGSPRTGLKATGTLKRDAEQILAAAKREGAELVVVGLPVEESGEEGRMARICRMLGKHLQDLGANVDFVDERYTSIEAQENLTSAGVRSQRQKELIHGEAAMLILERFSIESQKG